MTDIARGSSLAMAESNKAAFSEWRAGWILVLVSLIGYAISGTHAYTLGVFMPLVEAEFGWTRAQVSSGMLVYSVMGAMLSPFAGALIDRFGARRVGVPGMACYCIVLGLASAVFPPIMIWWSLWALIGLTSVFTKATLWGTAISRHFVRQRGVALAIVLCGSSLSSAAMPSIANWLIDHYGWRHAYAMLAGGNAVIIMPLMLLFFRSGRAGASTAKGQADAHDSPSVPAGYTARESILSYRFLALALPALFMTTVLMGMVVHFVPMLTAKGMDKTVAAGLMGALGVGSVIGRLVSGVLLDRYRGHIVGALVFLLPLIPIGLLLGGASGIEMMALVAFLVGCSFGSEMDITIYLSSRYFGMRAYGTILGTIMAVMLIGNGGGSTLAGWIFDLTGSYDVFLMAMVPLVVVAALLTRSMGDYPDLFSGEPEARA
ncbi:MAG: MFS transporter [Sphingobium sp.]